MKLIFTILFLTVYFNISRAQQIVPKEDYIFSKASGVVLRHSPQYHDFKATSLYFNDKYIIMSIEGFRKVPFYFKISSKRYSTEDKEVIIVCYSNELLKQHPDSAELKKIIPSLSIEINYNAIANEKKYVDVICNFYWTGEILSFGMDSKSLPGMLPAIRKKYNKTLSN